MRCIAVLLLGFLAIAGITFADTVYSTRDSFDAALGSFAIFETWDEFSNGTLLTNANGISYSPSNGTALVTNVYVPLSPPNTLGENFSGFFFRGESITFTFAQPVTAFGISFSTFATGAEYLITTNTGSSAPSFFDPFPNRATGEFAGLIASSPFLSVTVSDPGLSFSYTLDNLTYASRTPEPGTFLLLATSLLGLGVLKR
jgi:hypothetical protein